jgi:hypothetical protein
MVEQGIRLVKLKRKEGKFVVVGSVDLGHCPVCGAAATAISAAVPIELEGLACSCGSKNFRFAINSLKPNRPKNPTDWQFELDVICISCKRQKFIEKVLSFFKLKRIKVGPLGVDVQVK